jgi:septum formation protein
MRLMLASASPRRRDLLREAGVQFEVAPSGVEEDLSAARPGAAPAEVATGLALRKALARARLEAAPGLALGADTIVAVDGEMLGTPGDEREAGRMIHALAGREHEVATGVAVVDVASGACRTRAVTSAVRFRALRPEDVARYVATGLWRGKAGAYGVQDGAGLVEEVRGSVTNVIGLPVEETLALIAGGRGA